MDHPSVRNVCANSFAIRGDASSRLAQEGEGIKKVRILAPILALALLASPAYAQNIGGMGGGGMGSKGGGKGRNSSQNTEQQKADQQKKKAADEAYKAGVQGIPDAKENYDPWRGAR